MTRQAIATSGAPGAIGPYSQAIATDGLLFCSGQLGLDPATGDLVDGRRGPGRALAAQPRRGPRRGGPRWPDVVKTTIFLADIADFAAVNAVYASLMPDPPPARSTVEVAALPKAALVEIEAIAQRPARAADGLGRRTAGCRRARYGRDRRDAPISVASAPPTAIDGEDGHADDERAGCRRRRPPIRRHPRR